MDSNDTEHTTVDTDRKHVLESFEYRKIKLIDNYENIKQITSDKIVLCTITFKDNMTTILPKNMISRFHMLMNQESKNNIYNLHTVDIKDFMCLLSNLYIEDDKSYYKPHTPLYDYLITDCEPHRLHLKRSKFNNRIIEFILYSFVEINNFDSNTLYKNGMYIRTDHRRTKEMFSDLSSEISQIKYAFIDKTNYKYIFPFKNILKTLDITLDDYTFSSTENKTNPGKLYIDDTKIPLYDSICTIHEIVTYPCTDDIVCIDKLKKYHLYQYKYIKYIVEVTASFVPL